MRVRKIGIVALAPRVARPRDGGGGTFLDLVRKPDGLAQFVQFLRSQGDGVS